VPIDWNTTNPTKPSFLGLKEFKEYPLDELAKYIDWTPFFQTWEMAGRFPAILTDHVVGVEATKLYHDAQVMLQQIINKKMFFL
jgi:5-methyltetrahydrofolate--homocysteine methyltransferase